MDMGECREERGRTWCVGEGAVGVRREGVDMCSLDPNPQHTGARCVTGYSN